MLHRPRYPPPFPPLYPCPTPQLPIPHPLAWTIDQIRLILRTPPRMARVSWRDQGLRGSHEQSREEPLPLSCHNPMTILAPTPLKITPLRDDVPLKLGTLMKMRVGWQIPKTLAIGAIRNYSASRMMKGRWQPCEELLRRGRRFLRR